MNKDGIYVIETEDGYYCGLSECGRYHFLSDVITEEGLIYNREEAERVHRRCGGKIVEFNVD